MNTENVIDALSAALLSCQRELEQRDNTIDWYFRRLKEAEDLIAELKAGREDESDGE